MASVSRGYISRLEAGDFARPSAALLLRIAHSLEIDVENLWEDISSSSATRSDQPTLRELADQLQWLSQTLGTLRGVPVRGAASAGNGEAADERPPRLLQIEDAHVPPRRWAMLVDGESLKGDDIHTGDYVIVDPDLTPCEGMLVLAKVGEDVMIKRYQAEQSSPVSEPENPDYPAGDAPQMQILGGVYAIVRVMDPQRVASLA
jgi:SOS-response transcriptional repressor LexA